MNDAKLLYNIPYRLGLIVINGESEGFSGLRGMSTPPMTLRPLLIY